jgi:hypothetical protein
VPEAQRDDMRVVHGRDGFVLASDPLTQADPLTVRLFDGPSGRERYSIRLDHFRLPGRADLALAESALVLADAGYVHLIRSATR